MLAHIMSSYRNAEEAWHDIQGRDVSIRETVLKLTIVGQTI